MLLKDKYDFFYKEGDVTLRKKCDSPLIYFIYTVQSYIIYNINFVPQFGQKLDPALFGVPQFGQNLATLPPLRICICCG